VILDKYLALASITAGLSHIITEMPTWVNKNMGGEAFKKGGNGRNFGYPKSM